MLIKCPSCLYQREVPESAVRPGKTYKVTCPKCSSTFPFSIPSEPSPVTEEDSSSVSDSQVQNDIPQAVSATPASSSEAPSPDTESPKTAVSPESRVSSEQEGDDPLPEGAVIPQLPKQEENRSSMSQPAPPSDDREQTDGILGRWIQIRDHLRRYDENREEEEDLPTDGRPEGAPWENPQYYGVFGSFSRTVLGVMFRPRSFFRHLRCSNPVLYPVFFFVLLSLFQMLASRLWSIKALNQITMTSSDPQMLAMAETLMKSMNLPLMLLITPFFSIFQAIILAGLYHLMIRMVCPDRADFTLTLRVICYSSAPLVLCIAPVFGSLAASIWFVAATFMGCMYALNISFLRTLGALLPLYILELAFVMQIPGLMGILQ